MVQLLVPMEIHCWYCLSANNADVPSLEYLIGISSTTTASRWYQYVYFMI